MVIKLHELIYIAHNQHQMKSLHIIKIVKVNEERAVLNRKYLDLQ